MGLDFEQYSLNYRLGALSDQKFKRTRYFLGQEAAAAGSMTAAIIGTDQTYKALHRPQEVSINALRNLQTIGEVTSIIGACSSGVELTANGWHLLKDRIKHRDPKSATKYLTEVLRQIDKILAERDALLASNTELSENQPRWAQYQAETELLKIMRDVIVTEHIRFEATKVGFRTQENIFYALNIGSSIVSALQYRYGYKAVRTPKFGGSSAVFSTLSAGQVMLNPVVAAAGSRYAKRKTMKLMDREFGVLQKRPSVDELKAAVVELQNASAATRNDASCQATSVAILEAYGVVNEIFPRELISEMALLHQLEQVAVQNVITSQPIGGLALASGVHSLLAYYRYADKPRKAGYQNHASSITGLCGASLATGLTGVGYVADLWYTHVLRSKGQLPEQLMEQRVIASKAVADRIKKLMEELPPEQQE
ncbi:MAG TPA: hypothetical protein EYN91_09825 [Candidatus Melainabacteria bacterium]|nr:hypothetical protein [Candidatus Melainabacteria bacterium]HIN66245.1 hypothetical protein [Candidatus Obscuribacterales bacterium]